MQLPWWMCPIFCTSFHSRWTEDSHSLNKLQRRSAIRQKTTEIHSEADSDFCGERSVKACIQLKSVKVTKDFSEYIKRNFSMNKKSRSHIPVEHNTCFFQFLMNINGRQEYTSLTLEYFQCSDFESKIIYSLKSWFWTHWIYC